MNRISLSFLDLTPPPVACPLPPGAHGSPPLLARHPRILARLAQVTALVVPQWLPRTFPATDEALLQQATDLFDHIHTHCFPLDLSLIEMFHLTEEPGEDEWQLLEEAVTYIPFRPWGIDLCAGWVSDLRDPLAFVIYLLMLDGPGDAEARAALGEWIDPADIPPALEVHTLLPALARLPPATPPLDGLPDLIRYALQDTDTVYLDGCPSCESYGTPDWRWSTASVAWLREEWARAEPVWERLWALVRWADTEPAGIQAIWRRLLHARTWEQLSDEYGYTCKGTSSW